jgi:hypothetical protein
MGQKSDLPTVGSWALAFHREANPDNPIDPVVAMQTDVEKQRVFVWDDEGATSMAVVAGRTGRSVRISIVYTPPEHRRRGYASAGVADLTQRLLKEGAAFCSIITDATNPTSNKIYQAIGYQFVCDMAHIELRAG